MVPCAGFLINTITEGSFSGWSFELGLHQRVWWIDGGDEPPFVIVAGTPGRDRSFQSTADDLLASLEIGEPEPHPDPENAF